MSKRAIFKYSSAELTKLVEDESSCVSVVNSIFDLELFPYHLADISGSIKDLLTDKITIYCKRLDGILLGYKNLTLLTPQGAIVADSCYIHVSVEGDFYVFRPKVESILTGVVNKISKNHINCLALKVFNISVPIPHNNNEDWIGFHVDVGQEVKLLVTKMELNARLPYIRASLISSTPMNKNNKIGINDNDDESCNKKSKKNRKKKSSEKIKLQNNSVLGENETEEFATPKERKKKKSKLADKSQEDIEVNSLADFTTPVPKKEKKSKRISDLVDQEENNNLHDSKNRANKISDKVKEFESEVDGKKKRKTDTYDKVKDVGDSVINRNNKRSSKDKQRERTTSDLESENELKKKKKKSDKVADVVDSIINKNKRSSKEKQRESLKSELEFEHEQKKKKRDFEKVTDVVDSFINKKNKCYSGLELDEDGNKMSETLNDVVESFINKQISAKETDKEKRKRKRRNSDKHADITATNESEIIEEANDCQRTKSRKSEKSKMGAIFTSPPLKSMANDEDRSKKKKRSSTPKQILWDKNEGLNLYDSDLEEILKKEKKEPVGDFDVVKITALNEGETIPKSGKRKNNSSSFEEHVAKKAKRKSK